MREDTTPRMPDVVMYIGFAQFANETDEQDLRTLCPNTVFWWPIFDHGMLVFPGTYWVDGFDERMILDPYGWRVPRIPEPRWLADELLEHDPLRS